MQYPTTIPLNSGDNCFIVNLGKLTLWFSYTQMVAFKLEEWPIIIKRQDKTSYFTHSNIGAGYNAGLRHVKMIAKENPLRLKEFLCEEEFACRWNQCWDVIREKDIAIFNFPSQTEKV